MLTDTHCHILSEKYDNVAEILKNLKQNNIKRVIINGYNHKTNQEVIKLIEKHDNVYGAIGVHPADATDNLDEALDFIKKNLNHPKIVAIGEIGLDYHWNPETKEKQINCFIKQLELAKEYQKPIIVHNRDSDEDMLKILANYDLKGIMHCFGGNYEQAKSFIDLGYKLGINGILTFKNSELSKVLKKIDVKNILLETDAPYITPEPYRKEKNEPKYLNVIAEKVAEIYQINQLELSEILEENLYHIFDL